MNVLVDHCVAYATESSGNFTRLIDVLPSISTDKQVYEYAKNHNQIIKTCDKRFVLDIILDGKDVIYAETNKVPILIKPEIVQSPKLNDAITYYLLESDEILIP